MRLIPSRNRPKPSITARTHARLRFHYAAEREEHREANTSSELKLPCEQRSRFDTYQFVDEAILRSAQHVALVGDGSSKNYIISFDMGREVGYDALGKRRTSAVTVILSPIGEVITVHPGSPWSRDWSDGG